ncbi:MAG: hypothetical protein KIT39_17635 [Nitrospirales bacterium]|nr:hypothetical protein [Nitrospirales bacterium]
MHGGLTGKTLGQPLTEIIRAHSKLKGGFEGRYHATAIQTGESLARCLAYIDMNMVRAGVVSHPREWKESGYEEIQNLPRRLFERMMKNNKVFFWSDPVSHLED